MNTDRLNYYRRLARTGNKGAQRVVDAFDPNQPREPDGKWGEGGASSGGGEAKLSALRSAIVEQVPAHLLHREEIAKAIAENTTPSAAAIAELKALPAATRSSIVAAARAWKAEKDEQEHQRVFAEMEAEGKAKGLAPMPIEFRSGPVYKRPWIK
jgi:hypothetical protein